MDPGEGSDNISPHATLVSDIGTLLSTDYSVWTVVAAQNSGRSCVETTLWTIDSQQGLNQDFMMCLGGNPIDNFDPYGPSTLEVRSMHLLAAAKIPSASITAWGLPGLNCRCVRDSSRS